MSSVRITPRSIEQCFQMWKTRYLPKHKGAHVCIRDKGHDRGCLCACGTQRRDPQPLRETHG